MIDPVGGNHANQCDLCKYAKTALSKNIENVCAHFAKKAGYNVDQQPSLSKLLGDSYDMSSLANVFPKKGDSLSKKTQERIQKTLQEVSHLPDLEKRQVITTAIHNIPRRQDQQAGALRLDLQCTPANLKGHIQLCDVTTVHATCDSYCKRQYNFLVKAFHNEMKAWNNNHTLYQDETNTPSVTATSKRKHKMYGLIEKLINLQSNINSNTNPATMVPLAVSSRGEFGSEFINFIEVLTKRFRHKIMKTVDPDGMSVSQRTALFRMTFKNSVIAKIAQGQAKMMRVAHLSGPLQRLDCAVQ